MPIDTPGHGPDNRLGAVVEIALAGYGIEAHRIDVADHHLMTGAPQPLFRHVASKK
jgi:hypothetical protein